MRALDFVQKRVISIECADAPESPDVKNSDRNVVPRASRAFFLREHGARIQAG
ncbi:MULTISPECIES: hypothetical protein [Sinorhizobium]|uniref:hypothetical protein n=1 Tax=Sinorhizobium TaxID=28105 RepID=UPI001304AA00